MKFPLSLQGEGRGEGRALFAALFLFALAAHAAPPAAQLALCDSCHGKDGNSAIPGTPSLAAQPVTFLENQLIFFREGLRASPIMQPLAKDLKDEEITALARHYFAKEAKLATTAKADKAAIETGRRIAAQRHCGQCHLPDYRGRDQMPRLAGQREDYLAATMIAYRDGKRTGADTTMSEVLDGLSDADIKALAEYLARP